jgi:hypothetical protein
MNILQKIGAYSGTVLAVGSFVYGVWTAAPVVAEIQSIYDKRKAIEHVTVMVEEVHQMQVKIRDLEIERDSLERKVNALLHGKFPYDSAYVLTGSGWKIYHKDTKWIYRRN